MRSGTVRVKRGPRISSRNAASLPGAFAMANVSLVPCSYWPVIKTFLSQAPHTSSAAKAGMEAQVTAAARRAAKIRGEMRWRMWFLRCSNKIVEKIGQKRKAESGKHRRNAETLRTQRGAEMVISSEPGEVGKTADLR